MIRTRYIPNAPLCMAMGAFDGIHIGHRVLLEEMKTLARQTSARPAVLTFSPHPTAFLTGKPLHAITDGEEREEILRGLDIDILIELPFDSTMAATEPEDFIRQVAGQCDLRGVAAGYNFRFGRQAAGDGVLLRRMGEELGFSVRLLDRVAGEEEVSSSHIRSLLESGCMERAEALLGRPFTLHGMVREGKHLGRTIGFPTLNIPEPADKVRLPSGVYVVRLYTENAQYPAVTNIGVNPTTDIYHANRIIETHVLAPFEEHTEQIRLEVLHYLRPERRFTGVEALKAQLQRDKAAAAFLGLYKG